MSRVSENEEIRDYVDTMCKDEKIVNAAIENPGNLSFSVVEQ